MFVLRVHRPDVLLPSLLPFILQSARFDDYVKRMWAGSTNKFLNKTPLMRYELPLPPLDEQPRIALTLVAAQRNVDEYEKALAQWLLLEMSVVDVERLDF
jgi:restriction endonuclease S subunit